MRRGACWPAPDASCRDERRPWLPQVLSEPEKRAAYDRGDDVEMGPGQAGFHPGGFPGGFPGGGFPGGGQRFTFRM